MSLAATMPHQISRWDIQWCLGVSVFTASVLARVFSVSVWRMSAFNRNGLKVETVQFRTLSALDRISPASAAGFMPTDE
jgi:hypothetical protein